ncbi:MAG: AmmeMemoRadiSam system radical SAM enzyme [Desulfobacteraceae bacterium]|nr:AmmeMemoRadiSam system radical SAM enzyme [Desulfobacteraceae bacterium]
MKEAMLCKPLGDGRVHCFLCSQHCRIDSGGVGKCGVRENRDGKLVSLSYGRLVAASIDPIEKKPLFHFYPGTTSYSIATAGCNFTCFFCQNSDISQAPRRTGGPRGRDVKPEDVARSARREGCATVSYTYTEPTVFMEFALDTAAEAKKLGLANVFVSNGYMTPEALDAAAPLLGAANVDLKAFTDKFYREQCGARLKPVLTTLEAMKAKGIWLEVTTLLVPGLNDDEGELRDIARFLVSLGVDTPWHVSRFYPTYLMTDRGPTPVEKIRRAREIGLEAGLRYVYTGNVPGESGESTYCGSCGEKLISRVGYSIRMQNIDGGKCRKCGTPLDGVGIE